MDYLVSGHGGLPAGQPATVVVPDGFEVAMFVQQGNVLPDDQAWPIYNHLLAGDTNWANQRVVHRYFEGAPMPNYCCWNYPEIQWNSGVFRVGAITTNNPVVNLTPYTEGNPLTLAQLFPLLAPTGGGTVYWVACTN